MGANKTDKAIDRASRAAGGQRKIVENFDQRVGRGVQHSSHSHKSSSTDEGKVCRDLRDLKPFTTVPNRKHDSFPDIMADPLSTLNEEDYSKWGGQAQKRIFCLMLQFDRRMRRMTSEVSRLNSYHQSIVVINHGHNNGLDIAYM